MSKISPSKAVELGYTSQATIYRDMSTGKVSFERNGKNRRLIDVSELVRVYGEPKAPNDTQREIDNSHNQSEREIDKDKIITILETQVQDLTAQISAERTEKTKLLDMLQTEQDKNRLLMLTTTKPKRTLADILNFFRIPNRQTINRN